MMRSKMDILMMPLILPILCSGYQGSDESPASSYRILMLLPFASPSMRSLFLALAKGLADRGHRVTILSATRQPIVHPNIEEVGHGLDIFLTPGDPVDLFEKRHATGSSFAIFKSILPTMARRIYEVPSVRELYSLRGEFDLIVVQHMFNEFIYPFLHERVFITLAPIGIDYRHSAVLGNPLNPSYVPSLVHSYPTPIPFHWRIHNLIMQIYFAFFWRNWEVVPRAQAVISEMFPHLPPLLEIERNQSLALISSHFSIDQVIPLLPNQVEVAGIHCTAANPLPQDLDDWIEGAGEEGVIYFSLGSVLRSATLPKNFIQVFLEAFKQLDQRVLWKLEEDIPGLPPNVLRSPWMPQQDILGHPKVKAFITHGGVLSITESFCHGGTPLLVLPVFGDQQKNALRVESEGFGLQVSWDSLTPRILVSAIKELTTNEKYRKKVQTVSRQFRDQPQPPLERAIWWTEYVIRHQGAPHLRSPAAALSWVEFLMLDVVLALHLLLILILFIAKKTYSKCRGGNKEISKRKRE